MKALPALLLGLCACAHGGPAPGAQLSGWRSGHPIASGQLCTFVRDYPTESGRLRDWAQAHPIEARDLLEWAADNPHAQIPQAFLSTHPGWSGYLPWRDPAVFALFDWASTHPDAARALASTPHGLRWAMDARGCP